MEKREEFVVGSIMECSHLKHWMNNKINTLKKVSSCKTIVYNSWKDESFSFEISMFEDNKSFLCYSSSFGVSSSSENPSSQQNSGGIVVWVQTWLDVWNTAGSSPLYPR